MLKKIFTTLAVLLLLLPLCACGLFTNSGNKTGAGDAHVKLLKEAEELADAAENQYAVGLTFQSEYVFGLAQAEVSSLRLAVDTVLWLKGEGAGLAEVIGDSPYKTWDEITGACPGSPVPFYFEGLLYKIQGETEAAGECFARAKYNPLYEELDFNYLRRMDTEELYALKNDACALEKKIYEQYAPRTVLMAERTGAEFSPAYHLAMASENSENAAAAAQCALNALLTGPMTPSLYATAAAYETNAGNLELALEIVNEGLFLAPEDASVNYMAATFAHASGDSEAAKTYLETAKKTASGSLLDQVNALYAQIGG